MYTNPLKTYIKAIQASKEGRPDEAEKLLLESLGMEKPTEYMKAAMPELTSYDNPNDAVLALVAFRMRGGEI
jgi:hypothetical protein